MIASLLPQTVTETIHEIPWEAWWSFSLLMLSGVAAIGKMLILRPTPNGNGTTKEMLSNIRKLEQHWVVAEPMFLRMAEVLDATARALDQRTPIFQGIVRALERLDDQFREHDTRDTQTFEEIRQRLRVIETSVRGRTS